MPVIDTAITVSFQVRNAATGAPVTGDAANLTLKIVADGVDAVPTNSPVEVALGEYKLVLTAAENSGELMSLIGTSATASTIVIPSRWANLDASISSRATPGSLAAIVSLVEISGGTMKTGESIELIRGDARTLAVALTDSDSAAVDLTAYSGAGATVTLTAKDKNYRGDADDTNAILQVVGTVDADPTTGIVSFAITPADTEALEIFVTYDYDIQADDGSDGVVTFARGELELGFDVTRVSSAT